MSKLIPELELIIERAMLQMIDSKLRTVLHDAVSSAYAAGRRDARIDEGAKHEHDQHEANARLIAAAPDLLKELKWVSGRIDRNSGSPNFTSDEHDRIVAAIAKAEGN